ncbi:MAG: HAMP domain-containing histidine kinase, partial [Hyphomicrobiales bacterium]|nr:HAMP domain-containing histidine kinase [Hyphomicrobiales bacterium]
MSLTLSLARAIDWLVPDALLADREMRTRARMFMFSHLFGPILGNVIPGYLFLADPRSAGTLAVLAGSICLFWAFPFLVKYTGRYTLLSFLSIQNLLFAILFGCYFYGGLSSPFLPWLVPVPLLAFFYVGASAATGAAILTQIAANLAGFIALFKLTGELPQTIDLAAMQGIGIISIISASIYVSMMALYYARILASQSEFEKEVSKHLETAAMLREATSQAERATVAKAEFLARMSHELRTPLNAVIGYSQMLMEDTDAEADPQAIEDLNRIHHAGHHLLSLVNAILDLSKIEAGKMDVFAEPFDLNALLGKARERWGRRTEGRTLTIDSEASIGLVSGDAAKLEQVIDAVVDNAIRYTGDGDVRISARAAAVHPQGESVEISISDQGPGIATELLPTLF